MSTDNPSQKPKSTDEAVREQGEAEAAKTELFVRPRPAHKRVDPIDDFTQEVDPTADAPHNSNYVSKSSFMSGRSYKRSRAEIAQLRKELQYGQYLEIPKGHREIFASREKRMRWKSFFLLLVVVLIIAAVAYFMWHFMINTWGL